MRAQDRAPLAKLFTSYFSFGEWMRSSSRAKPISIDMFMSEVVPSATQIELLFDGLLQGNLMSLTAPVDPDAGALFKWKNNFAWSYNGDITDSIKEKVKAAGGIRTLEAALAMIASGADRLGCSASVAIVQQLPV